MKILITGAKGFLSRGLQQFYASNQEHQVFLTTRRKSYHRVQADLTEHKNIKSYEIINHNYREVIEEVVPDLIFHLSAQSSPKLSWKYPEETFDANLVSTLNILESLKHNSLTHAKLIFFSTSSVYDSCSINNAISESAILSPQNPYAVSKLASEYLCHNYILAYGVKAIVVRPFFVTGPGKTGDVCSDWASRIVQIERREIEALEIGDIKGIIREFMSLKDAILAIDTIARNGMVGETYNISTGNPISLEELLNIFKSKTIIDLKITHTPETDRKINELVKFGNNNKLRKLGWSPHDGPHIIVENMLNFYRELLI